MQKTIAFFTDAHLGDPTPAQHGIDADTNINLVLQDISRQNFDEVVFGGDITETENYATFFESLQNTNTCYRVLMGNHDSHDDVIKHFKQASSGLDELYYFYEDEAYRYIYMDSSLGKISNEQLQWLALQLETVKKIIIFIHHPVLEVNTGMDVTYPLKNRNTVKELLLSSKEPVTIFCGHYHMHHSHIEGHITQYITPAVSFQVQKQEQKKVIPYNGDFGYRVIELSNNSLTTYLQLYNNTTFIKVQD